MPPAGRSLILLVSLLAACERAPAPPAASSPNPASNYVGSAACAGCHAAQTKAWRGSHHELAMQTASPASVLGDFGDARFDGVAGAVRFFRRDDRFLISAEGADGRDGEFEVKAVIGVDPLQQYLVDFPGGRLQVFPIAWDTSARRWFDLYPGQRFAPGSPLHWTGRAQTWNRECAACHTTNLVKSYDPAADSYRTTWSEFDVGCEACHGAGSSHLAWARLGESARSKENDGLAVKAVDAAAADETCAACHSRRHPIRPDPTPGSPLLDRFVPELLREDLYQLDGQIREEVYEYGSFLQSRMHRAGVTCSDCHEPHGLGLRAEGDALCTRCHNEAPPSRFPSLRPRRYDDSAHHFHLPGSAGARCVNCHMPSRVYMQVDARRDHEIRVPDPALSAKLGSSDACTSCHANRTRDWASAAIASHPRPSPGGGTQALPVLHGEALTVLDAHSRGDWESLTGFAGDTGEAPFVRASALALLDRAAANSSAVIAAAGRDGNGLVRVGAAMASRLLAPEARLALLLPLLDDPLRAVRTAAVRMLADVPPGAVPSAKRDSLARAKQEYLALLEADADQPLAHLNLAALAEQAGRASDAEQEYRKALALDADCFPAVLNLSLLLERSERSSEAEGLLRAAVLRSPEQGDLLYSLALLVAEQGHLEEAVPYLQKAARALPRQARVRYNLGLALQRLGRRAEAESALVEAQKTDPSDADIMKALAIFYAQQQDMEGARRWAEKARNAQPVAP